MLPYNRSSSSTTPSQFETWLEVEVLNNFSVLVTNDSFCNCLFNTFEHYIDGSDMDRLVRKN